MERSVAVEVVEVRVEIETSNDDASPSVLQDRHLSSSLQSPEGPFNFDHLPSRIADSIVLPRHVLILRRKSDFEFVSNRVAELIALAFQDLVRRTGLLDDLAAIETTREAADATLSSSVIALAQSTTTTTATTTKLEGGKDDNKLLEELLEGRQIVGFNAWADKAEDRMVSGIGPIAIATGFQGGGVGRKLMGAVMAIAAARGYKSHRLIVNSHNPAAISLYVSLGFETRTSYALVAGVVKPASEESRWNIEPMQESDIDACCALCIRAAGISRRYKLEAAMKFARSADAERAHSWQPLVVREKESGTIVGYTSGQNILQHSVYTDPDQAKAVLQFVSAKYTSVAKEALQKTVDGSAEPNDQVPWVFVSVIDSSNLLRWCLQNGMHLFKFMNSMTTGQYQPLDPTFTYFSSVTC